MVDFKRALEELRKKEKKMTDKPIYIGSGKQVEVHEIIGGSICLTDIPQEHVTTSDKNGKKYLNISILKKRETDQWGKTHAITVNTWKPTPKGDFQAPAPSDLPF